MIVNTWHCSHTRNRLQTPSIRSLQEPNPEQENECLGSS